MVYFLVCICVILAFAQLAVIFRKPTNTTKSKRFSTKYPQHILEKGSKMMQDTKKGIVKKQLLENDAPIYNSGRSLKQYNESLANSSIQRKVCSLSGKEYNG